jgi:hypothetical protein
MIRAGVALGLRFNHRTHAQQCWLAPQHFVDPAGQIRPVGFRQVEVGPQIQQRALLDGVADAYRRHQAVGEVGLSGLAVARIGAANEHGGRMARHGSNGKRDP